MVGPMDLLLRHASLIDGTGSPARPADVAVTGDRIAAIARFLDSSVYPQFGLPRMLRDD